MKKIILILTALILTTQASASSQDEIFNGYFAESSLKREFLSQLNNKAQRELGDAGRDELAAAFNYSANVDFFDLVRQAIDQDTDQQIKDGNDTCREQMWFFYYGKVEKAVKSLVEEILEDIDFAAVNFFYPLDSYVKYLKWKIVEVMESRKFKSMVAIHNLNLRQLKIEHVKKLNEYYEKRSLLTVQNPI